MKVFISMPPMDRFIDGTPQIAQNRQYQVFDKHVIEAIQLSMKSGIHIWDYICVLPLYNHVEILYSCDEHFKHKSFKSLGPKIENPLDIWITL